MSPGLGGSEWRVSGLDIRLDWQENGQWRRDVAQHGGADTPLGVINSEPCVELHCVSSVGRLNGAVVYSVATLVRRLYAPC